MAELAGNESALTRQGPLPAHEPANNYSSGSSSDVDSLTEDLDQIGRFNLPKLSTYLNKESLPSLPNLPNLSSLGSFGGFLNLPQLPNFSKLPSTANLPSFDLADVSKYISQYVNQATSSLSGTYAATGTGSPDSRTRFVNSVKTSIATRMQMTSFLQDLRGGQSLQAALDRLQPITELIHEAITLPADDDSDEETEKKPETEPVGVGEIVNREQPFVNDLVLPDGDEIQGFLYPTKRKRSRRLRLKFAFAHIISDDNDSGVSTTDLDTVDGLTQDETRALTHLDSLNDFFHEDLLRQKIQTIQNLTHLSQHLKNKLVTKLMMGNYYKYIDEKLRQEGGRPLNPMSSPLSGLPRRAPQNTGAVDERLVEATTAQEDAMSIDLASNPSDDQSLAEDASMDGEEVVLTEDDTKPTWHDEKNEILGCVHYQRNCKLECPTCLKWYPCRFCHDAEISDHKLLRSQVKHILCMKCNLPQAPESSDCVNCEEELAIYFCLKCVLYDNDPSKDIYHCDKCGICRLGLGLSKDYFHCDTCNICLSIDLKLHHKCVTNTTHCDCPICNEYLFTSVSKVVFMKCGHLIHQACYDEMIKHSYKCPICKKTVVNTETQFRILDQEIRQLPLPAPYDKWRCIISCNDCKGKSNCAYHVMGLKCKYCQSFNTNQLKLIKPEEVDEEDEEEAVKNYEEDFNARISSMRLIKTNLSSNFLIGETLADVTDTPVAKESKEEPILSGDEDTAVMANMKKLTKAILGDRAVDKSSISAMFQSFINSTVADETKKRADIQLSDNESDSSSNIGNFRGF